MGGEIEASQHVGNFAIGEEYGLVDDWLNYDYFKNMMSGQDFKV